MIILSRSLFSRMPEADEGKDSEIAEGVIWVVLHLIVEVFEALDFASRRHRSTMTSWQAPFWLGKNRILSLCQSSDSSNTFTSASHEGQTKAEATNSPQVISLFFSLLKETEAKSWSNTTNLFQVVLIANSWLVFQRFMYLVVASITTRFLFNYK